MYNQIVVVGIVVSILFTEITGLSPAGLIVPGYIAICLNTPERVAYTVLVAFFVWGVSKILSNFIIIYGRRRFAVMIILSFCIDLILGYLLEGMIRPSVIGILVPGIMASEFEKQGVIKSLLCLGITVGIIAQIMLICRISVF